MLTPEQIQRWREMIAAATPGPWFAFYGGEPNLFGDGSVQLGEVKTPSVGGRNVDALFIAESRTALPLALDAVEELQGKVAESESKRESLKLAVDPLVDKVLAAEAENERLRGLLDDADAILGKLPHRTHRTTADEWTTSDFDYEREWIDRRKKLMSRIAALSGSATKTETEGEPATTTE